MTSGGLPASLRVAGACAVLAILMSSAASAGGPTLSATLIRGDTPLRVDSGSATVAVESEALASVALDATAPEWAVRVVSETAKVSTRDPAPPNSVFYNHSEMPVPQGLASFQLGLARHDGARVIIQPLSGGDYHVAAASRGAYTVASVPRTILEQSHYWSKDTIPPDPDYYEYTVEPSLNLSVAGETAVTVAGDFQLYVWGFTGTLQGSGGATTVVTDRKSTRLNSSHGYISYAVFCLK